MPQPVLPVPPKLPPASAWGAARVLAPWVLAMLLMIAGGIYFRQSDRVPVTEVPAAVPKADVADESDPVARFTETRIGQLLFMQPDGRICRRVLFDNVGGGYKDVGHIDCAPPEQPQSGAVNAGRLDAIRNSFNR